LAHGCVLIIATTNRPQDIAPAILRPGRIDREVFMGPPKVNGRQALFAKLISHMPVADDVAPGRLAAMTKGLSGAQIEHITNQAGLLAIKEAIAGNAPPDSVVVCKGHFQQAIDSLLPSRRAATPIFRGGHQAARV